MVRVGAPYAEMGIPIQTPVLAPPVEKSPDEQKANSTLQDNSRSNV